MNEAHCGFLKPHGAREVVRSCRLKETGVAMTAEQAADCMCECLRLAALTDDPQIRNQLTQQAQHWMGVAKPALRATRGQAWPFLYADEHAPWD